MPNVEVRVFNPFPGGRSAIWSRILTSISDIPRINHRMHNKLFVADNALAITGGRNIGDEYFTLDKHSNFIDLDVVGGGTHRAAAVGLVRRLLEQQVRLPDRLARRSGAGRAARGAASPGADGSGVAQAQGLAEEDADWLRRELDAHLLKLDLGARHRACGPARQDRERYISRSRK